MEINQARYASVDKESGVLLSPFSLDKIPLVSFEDSLKPLQDIVPNLDTFIWICNEWLESLQSIPEGLSQDEANAIHIYTREWQIGDESLYHRLNTALRSEDRKNIDPFLQYLKLLITALCKLPSYSTNITALWCGMSIDDISMIDEKYKIGSKICWWGFSSCTSQMDIINQFLDKSTDKRWKILFNIHYISHAVDIKNFSLYPKESEILLLPGRYLRVRNKMEKNELIIIEMEEIQSPPLIIGMNIPSIKSNISSQSIIPPTTNTHKELMDKAEKEFQIVNYSESFKLFSELSTSDQTGHAIFRLGSHYYFGRGIATNEEKIKEFIYSSFFQKISQIQNIILF